MTDVMLPFIQKTLQRSDGKNVIVLMSGEGGNGKTWVSVALANILADMGQKVLLFDGDLGLANIDVQLGITSYQDMAAVLTGKVPMNKAIVPYDLGGFDIITGRSTSHSLRGLDASSVYLIKEDLMLLATHYDTVIVDLGSSSDIMTRVFCEGVGTVLLFCTDELTSLIEARTLLKTLSDKGYISKSGIVVNAVPSLKEGNRTYYTLIKACDEFTKVQPPLIGVIRKDVSVLQALDSRLPVFNAYPDCMAIQDVKNIVKVLKNE